MIVFQVVELTMQGVGGILQQKRLSHTSNLSGFDVCHA